MAKGYKLTNFLLCDMIVTDIYNKNTLVGVYGGEIIVPQMPTRLRFAVYGEFISAIGGKIQLDGTLRLDKQSFARVKVEFDTKPVTISALALPQFEVAVNNASDLSMIVIVNETGRPQEVLRKKIVQGPIPHPPIVLPPPSEQSPASVPRLGEPLE